MEKGVCSSHVASTKIDCKQAVKQWNEGKTVWSVELGGLGPSYEQAIQVLVFELMKDNLGKRIDALEFGELTIKRLDEKLGFSASQVAQAKSMARQFLMHGYAETLAEVKRDMPDRLIQVDRNFPRWEE